MALKSQDVYVVLKIVSAGSRRPYSQLASELVMSPSEAHACVKRAQASHLLHGPALHNRPNVAALEEYAAFGDRLRGLGFAEDTSEGAPLCRWVRQETILDVMPLDEKILGFSNRWCRAAMETAVKRRLSDELEIRLVTAPFFVATKLKA